MITDEIKPSVELTITPAAVGALVLAKLINTQFKDADIPGLAKRYLIERPQIERDETGDGSAELALRVAAYLAMVGNQATGDHALTLLSDPIDVIRAVSCVPLIVDLHGVRIDPALLADTPTTALAATRSAA